MPEWLAMLVHSSDVSVHSSVPEWLNVSVHSSVPEWLNLSVHSSVPEWLDSLRIAACQNG